MDRLQGTGKEIKYRKENGEPIEYDSADLHSFLSRRLERLKTFLAMMHTSMDSRYGEMIDIGEILVKEAEKEMGQVLQSIDKEVGGVKVDLAKKQPGFAGGEFLGVTFTP